MSTAEILTEARRAYRAKPAKDVSATARAADDWIAFLDSRPSHPRVLSDPEVYKVADAFFKTQDKAFLNEAGVPIKRDSRYPQIKTSHLPPRGLDDDSRLPPTPASLTFESRDAADRNPLLRATRKRSASPPPRDRSPKSRRYAHDTQVPAKTEERPEQPGYLHTKPPTSPRWSSHSNPLKPEPPSSALVRDTKDTNGPASSRPPHIEDSSALKARIKSLEAKLAAAESKLKTPATTTPPTQLGEDMGGLKKDMATVTNVISTMMDSMHTIVDSLNLLQDDISGLSRQQAELTAALPAQTGKADTSSLLQPIQDIAHSVKVLTDEVHALKQRTSLAPSPPQPANSALEALLQEQNSRIDKLTHEMASMQAQMVTSLPRQQPQTLRQAMDAAERELSHHMATIQRFYHQLDGTRGGNRAVTERTADCLAMLQQTVQTAKMWQQGC